MKRTLTIFAVMLVMAAMMVAAAMPAFAHHGGGSHAEEDPGILPAECEVGSFEGPGNSRDTCLVNV